MLHGWGTAAVLSGVQLPMVLLHTQPVPCYHSPTPPALLSCRGQVWSGHRHRAQVSLPVSMSCHVALSACLAAVLHRHLLLANYSHLPHFHHTTATTAFIAAPNVSCNL